MLQDQFHLVIRPLRWFWGSLLVSGADALCFLVRTYSFNSLMSLKKILLIFLLQSNFMDWRVARYFKVNLLKFSFGQFCWLSAMFEAFLVLSSYFQPIHTNNEVKGIMNWEIFKKLSFCTLKSCIQSFCMSNEDLSAVLKEYNIWEYSNLRKCGLRFKLRS